MVTVIASRDVRARSARRAGGFARAVTNRAINVSRASAKRTFAGIVDDMGFGIKGHHIAQVMFADPCIGISKSPNADTQVVPLDPFAFGELQAWTGAGNLAMVALGPLAIDEQFAVTDLAIGKFGGIVPRAFAGGAEGTAFAFAGFAKLAGVFEFELLHELCVRHAVGNAANRCPRQIDRVKFCARRLIWLGCRLKRNYDGPHRSDRAANGCAIQSNDRDDRRGLGRFRCCNAVAGDEKREKKSRPKSHVWIKLIEAHGRPPKIELSISISHAGNGIPCPIPPQAPFRVESRHEQKRSPTSISLAARVRGESTANQDKCQPIWKQYGKHGPPESARFDAKGMALLRAAFEAGWKRGNAKRGSPEIKVLRQFLLLTLDCELFVVHVPASY